MTEAEWLAHDDPAALLEFLWNEAAYRRRPHPSRRKLRLFACACCRRVWPALADGRARRAVEVAERYADRRATRQELALACAEARAGVRSGNAGLAALAAAAPNCDPGRAAAQAALAGDVRRWAEERAAQCRLLRDLFGNPFRPAPVLEPAWLSWNGGALAQLARSIYDDRNLPQGNLDPVRLSDLASALEEAGCTDTDILAHCREPGEHVRGCWVVDLLLGRA